MHRKHLGIALGTVAVAAVAFWVFAGRDSAVQDRAPTKEAFEQAAFRVAGSRQVVSQYEPTSPSQRREPGDTLGSDDVDGGNARRRYAYVMGEAVPPKYLSVGQTELERLLRSGDRHAARRLADVKLESGDVLGAINGYQHAAELGSPAALAMVAALTEPDSNMYKEILQGKFGVVPPTDIPKAYIAAKVASWRGYRDAYFVLDRVLNHVAPREAARLDQLSRVEYERLYTSYRARYGSPPQIPLDPVGQDDFNRVLRANR